MASVNTDTRAVSRGPRTPTKSLAKTPSGRSVIEDAENIYVPSPEVDRYSSVFGLKSNYGSDFEITDSFTSSDGSPIPPPNRRPVLQTISPSQSQDSILPSAKSSPIPGISSQVLGKSNPPRAKKGLARTETIVIPASDASGAQGSEQRQLPPPPTQQSAARPLPLPPNQQLSPPTQRALPAGRYLAPSKQNALPAGRFLVPAKQFQPPLPAKQYQSSPTVAQPKTSTTDALARPRPIRPFSKPTLPPGSYPVPTRPAPPPPADKKVKRKPVVYPQGVEPLVGAKGEGERVHKGAKGELGGDDGAANKTNGDVFTLGPARDPVFTRPTHPKPLPPFPPAVHGAQPVFTRPDGPLPPLKIDATSRALLAKITPSQPANTDTHATFSPAQTSSSPRRRPLPPLPAAPPSSPIDGVPPAHPLVLPSAGLPWSPRDIEESIERARRAQLASRVDCASRFDEPCGCAAHVSVGRAAHAHAADSGEPARVPGAIHRNISEWARSVQAGLAPEDAPEVWVEEAVGGGERAVEEDEATDVEDEQEYRDGAPYPALGSEPSPSLDNGPSPVLGNGSPTWSVQPRRPAYDFSAIARAYLSSAADGRSAVGIDQSDELGDGIARRGPLSTIEKAASYAHARTIVDPAPTSPTAQSDVSTEPDSTGPSDSAYDASMSSNQESSSDQGSDRTLAVPGRA
ncbi:uncharacterized protein SCHCODRAFT_02356400 [Schizophyllum commune H4-8]|uniref:Uncharacterized protein n=1 Tax=Schizophyllum commune (strain H4-8 / FGSC 9210) TaxID=578458 RepID=D8QAY4_SCHCM|nr:uncharacterized protein SCHCODRAFT_02356400 [Schizophyllum commune H4-8]KAI5888962.1 hypothetical protein SCHCODRAFT_02356400 [Schizophyllum commune H4-8]